MPNMDAARRAVVSRYTCHDHQTGETGICKSLKEFGVNQPCVSIVTVTYNSGCTLAETIASVQNQTYPRIEHVIIDGGSSDETIDLIRKAAAKGGDGCVRWLSERDEGIYDAMNKGIHLSSGSIVGLLNSDDVFNDRHVVQDIVDKFRLDDCDALYGDLVFVDQNNTDLIRRRWIAGRGRMERGWSPPHPTLYLRRRVYQDNGPYRPDFKISADYEYMLRLFIKGSNLRVGYLERVLVRMRYGGVSTGDLSGNLTGFREAQESLESHGIRPAILVNCLRVMRKFKQKYVRQSPVVGRESSWEKSTD